MPSTSDTILTTLLVFIPVFYFAGRYAASLLRKHPLHERFIGYAVLAFIVLAFVLVLARLAEAGCEEVCASSSAEYIKFNDHCCCHVKERVACDTCPFPTPVPTVTPCAPGCTARFRDWNLTVPYDCQCGEPTATPPLCAEPTPTATLIPDPHGNPTPSTKEDCCNAAREERNTKVKTAWTLYSSVKKLANAEYKHDRAVCRGEQ